MGHDISGYKPGTTSPELAYLRRGAFNELNKVIYVALGADSRYGGVSGDGSSQIFNKTQLTKALSKLTAIIPDLPLGKDIGPELKFIAECIANLDSNDEIEIHFG